MYPRKWRWGLKAVPALTKLAGIGPPPEPPHPPERFVIVCAPRSGSSWLADLLNQAPTVTCHSELFAYEFFRFPPIGGNRDIRTWNSWSAEHADEARGAVGRLALFFQYFDRVVYEPVDAERAIGFKLLDYHIQRGFGIPAYLANRQVKIVHLIRDNYLDVVLSEEARVARGAISHATSGASVPRARFELDIPSLIPRLSSRADAIAGARDFLASLKTPLIEVHYESLREDPHASLARIFAFLGLPAPAEEVSSTLVKLNTERHQEMIANYEQVEEVLRGTPFAEFLR